MNASREVRQEGERRRQDREILYGWLTTAVLPILKEQGVWVAPNPAPLTAEEVKPVFERVAEHESYTRQHLITMTNDGKIVELQNGIARIEEEP